MSEPRPGSQYKYVRDRVEEEMDEKMREGFERWGHSWVEKDPEYMLDRVEEEFYELRQAIEHKDDPEEAIKETADQANYAIFAIALAIAEKE